MGTRRVRAAALLLAGGLALGVWGAERGPAEILPIDLPVVAGALEGDLATVARGDVNVPSDCPYCYLHRTQYRFVVPEGAVRLVLELEDETRPDGDLDLILRWGESVTEDEGAYYFSRRTVEPGARDRLELSAASEAGGLRPGEYYLGIVSLVENGDRFEIRGACYVVEPPPPEGVLGAAIPEIVLLEIGEEVAGSTGAGGDRPSAGVGTWGLVQYRLAIPRGAARLSLSCRTADETPLRLYVRESQPVEVRADGIEATVSFLIEAPSRAILPRELLRPGGLLFVAVQAPSGSDVAYTLRAEAVVPSRTSLERGDPPVPLGANAPSPVRRDPRRTLSRE